MLETGNCLHKAVGVDVGFINGRLVLCVEMFPIASFTLLATSKVYLMLQKVFDLAEKVVLKKNYQIFDN